MRSDDLNFFLGMNYIYVFIQEIIKEKPEVLKKTFGTDDLKEVFKNNSPLGIVRKYGSYEIEKKLEEFENEHNGRN